MAIDLRPYGSMKPIPFNLTLSGVGVNVTIDTDLVDGDIILITYTATTTASGTVTTRTIDVSHEIYECSTNVPGAVFWKPPSAGDSQCWWGELFIKDASGGGVFDENKIAFYTGGHANAYYVGKTGS